MRPLRQFSPLSAIAVAFAAACASPALAAESISTDRPDFVESSDVVGTGRVQIETGLSFESNKTADTRSRTRTTPTLLRLGVSDALEVRVETDGFVRDSQRDLATGNTQVTHGFSDTSLGLKWHQQDGDEASGKPGIAWLLHVDVNSGSSAFRGQGLRPSLRGVAEWDLPYEASVGVMGGVLLDRNAAGERFGAGILAVTLGKSWTPQWRTFVELAGQSLASRRNGGSFVTFDTGLTYLVNESVQLDLAASRGLNNTTPDHQWGVGVSVRF
jgi:hypothetical protein